jgi:replicative DNA helicase
MSDGTTPGDKSPKRFLRYNATLPRVDLNAPRPRALTPFDDFSFRGNEPASWSDQNYLDDSEQSVIGIMIRMRGEWDAEWLTPEHFLDERLGIVLASIRNVKKAGGKVDMASVFRDVHARGYAEAVNVLWLRDLMQNTGTSVGFEHHLDMLANAHNIREVHKLSQRIAGSAKRAKEWRELVNGVKAELANLEARAELSNDSDMSDGGKQLGVMLKELEDAQSGKKPSALSTGWPALDAMLSGGFRPGHLIVAAGRPGMGKSSFGTLLAALAAMGGHHVALYPFEETNEDVIHRIQAAMSGIPLTWFKRPDKNPERSRYAMETASQTSEWLKNLRLPDDPNAMTATQLSASAHRIHAARKLDLVVVDYLQRMVPENMRAQRHEQVEQAAMALKTLAKRLKCPVLALAQVGRKCEERTDKRPMMSDLRESGGIEAEANVILGLYRHGYYYPDDPQGQDEVEVIALKNRFGATGMIRLRWHGETTSLWDDSKGNARG